MTSLVTTSKTQAEYSVERCFHEERNSDLHIAAVLPFEWSFLLATEERVREEKSLKFLMLLLLS